MNMRGGKDGDVMAKEALDVYGVLDADDWLARLEGCYLTGVQKEQIKESGYVTLVMAADWGVRWPNPKPERIERSLYFLQRAQSFHEPTRAFFFVRSESHRVRGDNAASNADAGMFCTRRRPGRLWDYFPTRILRVGVATSRKRSTPTTRHYAWIPVIWTRYSFSAGICRGKKSIAFPRPFTRSRDKHGRPALQPKDSL